MKSIFQYRDFRRFLQDTFDSRKQLNPELSLRKFSSELQISPARLSEILNSKAGISMSLAVKIGRNLNMTSTELNYFLDIIRSKYGRSKEEQREAKKRVSNFSRQQRTVHVEAQSTSLLSKWYYLPLMELLVLKPQLSDAKVEKILSLDNDELQSAKLFLIKNNYVALDSAGSFIKNIAHIKVESKVPFTKVRSFHKQVLKLASVGVEQEIEKKQFLSSFFPIKESQIQLAKKELATFQEYFLKKFSTQQSKHAYCLSVQLFELI